MNRNFRSYDLDKSIISYGFSLYNPTIKYFP